MTSTPGLALSEHPSAGANSHTYANEAYRVFEAFLSEPLLDFQLNAPPGSPSEGDHYVIGSSPSGDWAAYAGQWALYLNAAWVFKTVKVGMRFSVSSSATHACKGATIRYEAQGWVVNNIAATVAPTVNDDVDLGYGIGSRWINVTGEDEYVCVDATDGAAVWEQTNGAGGGGGDPDQDLWATVTGDSGSTTANSTADSLGILGGTNCSTSVSGDDVTIDVPTGTASAAGVLTTTMWEEIRKAAYFAGGGAVLDYGDSLAQPGSPSDGDAYCLLSSPSGAQWSGNGNSVALYKDSQWYFFPFTDGMMVRVASASSSHFAKSLLAYSDDESLWYPTLELPTETVHWTGKYQVENPTRKIYARHFYGAGSNATPVNIPTSNLTNVDMSLGARAWGQLYRGSLAVTIPQNFSGIVYQVLIGSSNITLNPGPGNTSSFTYDVRVEWCQDPEP